MDLQNHQRPDIRGSIFGGTTTANIRGSDVNLSIISRRNGAPFFSNRAAEMSAGELITDERANGGGVGALVATERIEKRAIAGNDFGNRSAGGVEHGAITANAAAPEFRNEFGSLDHTRVQKTIAARAIGGDGKLVSGGIGEFDVRMLLDAQVAARGHDAVERGREHTMLEGHSLGAAIYEDVERIAVAGRHERYDLVGGQLHGCRDPLRAHAEQLGGGVRLEAVHGA